MFRPPRHIDEAPSPEAIRAVQEAQARAMVRQEPEAARRFNRSVGVLAAVAVLALTAFFSRLITAYFLMELVRVPNGVVNTQTQPAYVIPSMLPDELGYEDAVWVMNRVGFWLKPPLPNEIKHMPLADRLLGLPAAAGLLVESESAVKISTPAWLVGTHDVLIRGVRKMIGLWTGQSNRPWYRIPPYLREFLTVQNFAAAGAIVLLALFWRTPKKPEELEPVQVSFLNLNEDRLVALLAAWLMTVDPLLLGFSGLILSETLFTALLTMLLVAVVQPRFGYWQAAAAAGIGIFMVYTRPDALLFVAAVLLWRLWQDWPLVREIYTASPPADPASPPAGGQARVGRMILGALPLGVLAGVALSLLPWLIRNAGLPDGAWAMTSLTGPTMYDSLGPQANGSSNQEGFLKEAFAAGCRNEWQVSRYFKGQTWKALGENPLRLVTLIPAKLGATWAPTGKAGGLISGGTMWVIALWSVLLYTLAAAGGWQLWHAGQRKLVILLLSPAIVITMVHCVVVGSVRYRLPAIPGLDLLAAYAILPLLHRPWAWLTNLTAPAAQPIHRI